MKKLWILFAVALLAMASGNVFAETQELKLIFNGTEVVFGPMESGLMIDENGAIQIPAEKLAALTGTVVKVDPESEIITYSRDNYFVTQFFLEKRQMWSTQGPMTGMRTIATAPRLVEGICYVPLDIAFSEMGYQTTWNKETGDVSLTTKNETAPPVFFLSDVPNLSDFEIYDEVPDPTALINRIKAEDYSQLKEGTFKATYYDILKPDTVLGSEILDDIALKENQGKPFGISPNRLGAVIIGNISIETTGDYTVLFSHTDWLSSRGKVYIDGIEVLNTDDQSYITMPLKKGKHYVAVALTNNESTTQLQVRFEPGIPILTAAELKEKIRPLVGSGTEIQYMGVGDFHNYFKSVDVQIGTSSGSTMLFFSGSIPIKLTVPESVTIKGIVLDQYTSLEGIDRTKVPVYIYPELSYCGGLYPLGEDRGSAYELEDSGFRDLDKQLKNLTGKQIDVMYSADLVNISEVCTLKPYRISNEEYKKIYAEYQRIEETAKIWPIKPESLFVDSTELHSWGPHLLGSYSVPQDAFRGIYFNTDVPEKIVETEIVTDISINYMEDNFWGIKSEKIGGYWIGDWSFDHAVKKSIAVDANGSYRILVDGEVVKQGEMYGEYNPEVTFNFSKGKHRIEVEFMSNYFSTEFNVRIQDPINTQSQAAIAQLADEYRKTGVDFYHVLSRESLDGTSSETKIRLAGIRNPIVLILDTHNGEQWKILNPENIEIKAVFLKSFSPASSVDFLDAEPAPVVRVEPDIRGDMSDSIIGMISDLNRDKSMYSKDSPEYQAFDRLRSQLGIESISGFSVVEGYTITPVPAFTFE